MLASMLNNPRQCFSTTVDIRVTIHREINVQCSNNDVCWYFVSCLVLIFLEIQKLIDFEGPVSVTEILYSSADLIADELR